MVRRGADEYPAACGDVSDYVRLVVDVARGVSGGLPASVSARTVLLGAGGRTARARVRANVRWQADANAEDCEVGAVGI